VGQQHAGDIVVIHNDAQHARGRGEGHVARGACGDGVGDVEQQRRAVRDVVVHCAHRHDVLDASLRGGKHDGGR
jgi:hypothetical protein